MRPARGDDTTAVPGWLRVLAVVCAATSRLGRAAAAPALAPAGGAGGVGMLAPVSAALPTFTLPEVRCAMPLPDPSLADFLAGSGDAAASHWGLDGTSLWGDDDVVLTADGRVKAGEIRALLPDEQERAAALASILGQAPARLRDFAHAEGNQTRLTLRLPGPTPGASASLTLVMRNTVALYANGTRAAYAGRRGLLAPLARKLALQLRACVDGLRFNTSAEVFDAVLGNSAVQNVSATATLATALRAQPQRPLFGTLVQSGGIDLRAGDPNISIDFSGPGTRLWKDDGTLDYEVLAGTYGLLGVQLERLPLAVELYNPLGSDGPVDPPADIFRSNATTLVQRMPLVNVGNGVAAVLTLAS